MRNRKSKVNLNLNKARLILGFSIFLFVLSVVARLLVSSRVEKGNVELGEVYFKKTELEKEVSALRYQNLQLSTLSEVEKKATSMGFVAMTGGLLSLDINASKPLALNVTR